MRGFNYTALTETILVRCGYMWKFHYLLIHQYFKNLLLVLCCIVTSSPIYIYIACNFDLKLGKGTMYMFVYVHVQGMTDS